MRAFDIMLLEVNTMPKQLDPKIKEAEELHKSGMKLIDIAKKLDKPEGTIRRWKCEYWSKETNARKDDKKKSNARNEEKNSKAKIKEMEKLYRTVSEDLTEKQRLFCVLYVNNFNATQAAIKAGYSPKDAREQGYENLMKPHVRKEVERLKQLKRGMLFAGTDDILERYMRIAFADLNDFIDYGSEEVPVINSFGMHVKDKLGNNVTEIRSYVRFKNSNIVDGGLISEIKTSKSGVSIKLEDRQKALDFLKDYFDMNPMHKHKKWFDSEKIKLEQTKAGENEETWQESDGFLEAMNAQAGGVWGDYEE